MSNLQILAPNLLTVIDKLEINRKKIASFWIEITTVKSVFKARKISAIKFRDGYGIPIIEYFIAVVRGEKEVGNCPIMSKLVNYLLAKEITPREVFDICMGLRRGLILFLFKQEKVLNTPYAFMNEIAIIFDANLSGVLEIFTNHYADSQKKLQSVKIQKEKLQQTSKVINSIKTKIIIVQNNRIILANKPFLEMLDINNLKDLYLKYQNGFDFLNDIDLFENDFRVNLPRWIRKVCKNNKPFTCKIYNEKLKKIFDYGGTITNMPEEKSEQYIITLNNISDHIKSEEIIKDNLTHDELTGFRNYPTFEKLISRKVEEVKQNNTRMFLAIADIPNLREVNEKQGRSHGDMLIAEVAEDIRFLVDKDINIARLDGSRFGILIHYPTEQAAYDWCIALFKKMNERSQRKTLAITEVDLSESINKLFLRAYDLIELSNSSEDDSVISDFKNIMEYKELPEQKGFTNRLSKIKSLEMSIFYFELAITSKVEILSTNADSIKVLLSSKQIKVVDIDMPIYFKLDHIGNIKAYIKDIDKDKQTATIDRFRFDKHSPLNRKIYRIEVQEDIKAYIADGDREYSVKILDMNNECISIKIDRKRNFDINSLVYLDMLLPISDIVQSCAINAVIIRIDKVVGGYKMILLCTSEDENRNLLNKYITKNQINIIQNFQI